MYNLYKNISRLSLLSVLMISPLAFSKKLDTDKKKLSYTIGQQIGESFKGQGLDVDLDVLADSIEDSIKGKQSALSKEDMQAALMTAQKAMQDKMKAVADTNKKTGDTFLENNKKQAGVKVTSSGLQYKVVTEGKGATPSKDDTVVTHYKGTLIDGTEFDSSYKRNQPAEFPVGGVIPGWTEALLTMKAGEKRQLFIPSDLAYGPSGRPGIPPNSVLLFDIELLEVKKAAKKGVKAAATKTDAKKK